MQKYPRLRDMKKIPLKEVMLRHRSGEGENEIKAKKSKREKTSIWLVPELQIVVSKSEYTNQRGGDVSEVRGYPMHRVLSYLFADSNL